MKKICFTIFMALGSVLCQAQITQVNTMDEVFQHFLEADSKTLAIFDIDMVLVQPSDPAFQMANMKRFGAISKRIIKSVPEEKLMIFLSLMTLSSESVLIDERLPKYINQLIEKGVPTMALTANLTGEFAGIKSMEEWRIRSLKTLGIDFSKSAPFEDPILFDNLASYRGNYSTFLKGILFVNGNAVSKGEAFLAFLQKTKISPNKIIFIDDREENLKSLEAALATLERPIEYVGLHFTGAINFPSREMSEHDFEAHWQELASESLELK